MTTAYDLIIDVDEFVNFFFISMTHTSSFSSIVLNKNVLNVQN